MCSVLRSVPKFIQIMRRRLHGGDEGDRPHGQKVVGAMAPSRPHGNFMSLFVNIKMSQLTKGALISA